jgi:hypothetical protein
VYENVDELLPKDVEFVFLISAVKNKAQDISLPQIQVIGVAYVNK